MQKPTEVEGGVRVSVISGNHLPSTRFQIIDLLNSRCAKFPHQVRQVRHGDWTTRPSCVKLLPNWVRPSVPEKEKMTPVFQTGPGCVPGAPAAAGWAVRPGWKHSQAPLVRQRCCDWPRRH